MEEDLFREIVECGVVLHCFNLLNKEIILLIFYNLELSDLYTHFYFIQK